MHVFSLLARNKRLHCPYIYIYTVNSHINKYISSMADDNPGLELSNIASQLTCIVIESSFITTSSRGVSTTQRITLIFYLYLSNIAGLKLVRKI